MSIRPPIEKVQYDRQLHGFYGRFGSGAGTHAFYLQSVLDTRKLDWVSPISEIRDSERWPVSDLIQRDVDDDQVTNSLLPYLQDAEKIKFFNPLTLVLLPMQDANDSMLSQMPGAVESSMRKDDMDWDVIERPDYHRVRWVRDHPQYAVLEWSDTRTKLVAIDGQHRLSALKRLGNDRDAEVHQDFSTWGIPVVVVSFRAGTAQNGHPGVLDVVRNLFVCIHTEAQKINRTREILLSDDSVNAVFAQELVQLAHANDLKPRDQRIPGRLPLLFYDWRGEEEDKRRVHSPAAVKSIEEIHDWFEHYVLGENFSIEQEIALGIVPVHPLHGAFHHEVLNHADSKKLRQLAGEEIVPAVACLIENFIPCRSYVMALRELERKFCESHDTSDLARHAFHELRIGTNLAPDWVKPDVAGLLVELGDEIQKLKRSCLDFPMDRDIGMRGVVCAFGKLHKIFGRPGWMEYTEWFVEALNRLYHDGCLDPGRKATGRLLLHVVKDHNEMVVNDRLEDAKHALGAWLQLFTTAYGRPLPEEWRRDWLPWKDVVLDTLKDRILRGYKKQIRAQLRWDFPDGGTPLTNAVSREAKKEAGKHMRRLERKLEQVEKRRAEEK